MSITTTDYFYVRHGWVCTHSSNEQGMSSIKPIRQCPQFFSRLREEMLAAEKDLRFLPDGKYQFCPDQQKWINFPDTIIETNPT